MKISVLRQGIKKIEVFKNWLTFGQCNHDPKVKAVRAKGQITEVKQSRHWLTIWHPYILVFLSVWLRLAEILRKFAKFASERYQNMRILVAKLFT